MNHIHMIALGDIEALETLYEEYKVKVYRLALSLLGDTYLAEDVTQETFLRIQEHASSYRRNISEAAWIATIARNLSYDHLRRKNREISHDLDQEPEGKSSLTGVLEQQISESADSASDLYYLDLVAMLAPEEREIVNLRILADLSWKEIGKVMGQQADACRKRYRRALEKLEHRL